MNSPVRKTNSVNFVGMAAASHGAIVQQLRKLGTALGGDDVKNMSLHRFYEPLLLGPKMVGLTTHYTSPLSLRPAALTATSNPGLQESTISNSHSEWSGGEQMAELVFELRRDTVHLNQLTRLNRLEELSNGIASQRDGSAILKFLVALHRLSDYSTIKDGSPFEIEIHDIAPSGT